MEKLNNLEINQPVGREAWWARTMERRAGTTDEAQSARMGTTKLEIKENGQVEMRVELRGTGYNPPFWMEEQNRQESEGSRITPFAY